MSGKWMFRLWMAVGVLAAAWSAAAASPWASLISLNRVQADPKQAYLVTEDNGPWMVMACSFSGDGADKQAKELVMELRKRYKLPAYIYCGHFDPGEATARGFDKYGNKAKGEYWKYKNDKAKAKHPEITEVAVLVGNYRAADDSKAQATLTTLKYATPQCLEIKEGKVTHQTLTGWRLAQKAVYERIGSSKKEFGPMRHAFIVPNPLLPPDYFNQQSVDEETIAMNKGVPYDLLECPGKFTVRVATFRGNAVIRQNEIQDIEEGREQMKSQLAIAAQKANDLTIFLRAKGYEVYQFHDRYSSVVTIGSFKSPGRVLPNGELELDPEIQKIIDTYKAKPADPNDRQKPEFEAVYGARGVLAANCEKGLDKSVLPLTPVTFPVLKDEIIPLDVEPTLVRVPKRSFSMAPEGDE